jgi:hypothetical protein
VKEVGGNVFVRVCVCVLLARHVSILLSHKQRIFSVAYFWAISL